MPVHARSAWLESICADEPELRVQVEDLLSSHETDGFMLGPAAPTDEFERQVASLKPEEAGDQIGHYRLVTKIGEGGFGTVWLAEQSQPVKRPVALKIIKLGMDTREVIRRFEQERQALAVMDHMNIAKVYDAGATQFGRPYFVMELVRGKRITEYCDDVNLPLRERLELFIQVCQAVQHAHQKGIIHRDIKPSNILVSQQDGVAVPKVIDFGVAKAIHGRLTEETIATDIEQMIGTPLYMSPEQAEVRGLDVDTRSDIYSLGVLLYELLTGRTPFSRKEMTRAGYAEIRRMICEMEPKKPSAALQTMEPQSAIRAAARRQCEREKLIHIVRGDLDWITMKAMEKDRVRRYATANGFSMDIQRYLADEPVNASPPSPAYRFRKFVRRNRIGFSAAASAVAALVIGLVAALWQRDRAVRAEGELGNLLQREVMSRRTAELAKTRAEASESLARRISYASDMNLAQKAVQSTNVGLARQLLDRHRPKAGEEDLRDWEWRYLYQQCRNGALAALPTERKGIPVFSTSISTDEKHVLVSFADGQVDIWDLEARKLHKAIQGRVGQRAQAIFAPDGRNFVVVSRPGTVTMIDASTYAEKVLCTLKGKIRDLSFSRDGELLAVLCSDPDQVAVVRVADGNPVATHALPYGGGTFFNNARISPDKQRLYVSCGAFRKPAVRCMGLVDGQVIWEHTIGLVNDSDRDSGFDLGFSAMDLSPNGEQLVVATGYRDPDIRVLGTARGNLIKELQGHSRYVLQTVFSDDGRFLASTSEDQTVRLWDCASWTKLTVPLQGHNLEVNAVAISKSGRLLVSGNKDGEVFLWDLQKPPLVRGPRPLPGHIREIFPVPTNRMAAGKSAGNKWSLVDLFTLAEHPLPAEDMQADGYPRFVPKRYRRPPAKLDFSKISLKVSEGAWAISPNGKLLVAGSQSGEIGFYEADSLKEIEVVRSNLGSVFGVAFSPNGRRLLFTCGGNESIVLWDVETRQEIVLLGSNSSLLSKATFTDDGNTLLASSRPGTSTDRSACHVWSVPSWEEIEEAERIGGRWPLPEAFPTPPVVRTLPELKSLLATEYRERIARDREKSPDNAAGRAEALENVVEIYHQQNRNLEAEPYMREWLSHLRRQPTRDINAVYSAGKKLLTAILTRLEIERQSANAEDRAKLSREADALVDEGMAILTQRSIANPKDSARALRLAVRQIWLGRDSDHAQTCQRLIELAESETASADHKEHAAAAWALHRSADPALREKALKFAQEAAPLATDKWQEAWRYKTLGMVLYRGGNYAEARQAFLRADEAAKGLDERHVDLKGHLQSSVRLLCSMALFREGDRTKAGELFADAEKTMKPRPADDRQALTNRTAFDDIMLWLNYKEAKQLISGKDNR